jgi:hypothetical protein
LWETIGGAVPGREGKIIIGRLGTVCLSAASRSLLLMLDSQQKRILLIAESLTLNDNIISYISLLAVSAGVQSESAGRTPAQSEPLYYMAASREDRTTGLYHQPSSNNRCSRKVPRSKNWSRWIWVSKPWTLQNALLLN